MSRNRFLTPDTVPASTTCLTIEIPNSSDWRALLLGALLTLTEPRNWEQFGSVSVEDTAREFYNAWFNAEFGGCAMSPIIGEIRVWPGVNLPDGWLLCDGSELAEEDYPALQNVLLDTYGEASDFDHFLLPDLMGRFVRGQTGAFLGGQGGSVEHNHAYKFGSFASALSSAAQFVGYITGQTSLRSFPSGGSDTINWMLHNTGTQDASLLPPYLNLKYIIYAGA